MKVLVCNVCGSPCAVRESADENGFVCDKCREKPADAVAQPPVAADAPQKRASILEKVRKTEIAPPVRDDARDARRLTALDLPSGAKSEGDVELRPGDKLGPMTIRRLIGRGGTGCMYQAAHDGFGCDVAVKVVDRRLSKAFPRFVKELFMEAKAAAKIEHPGIARTLEFGSLGEFHFVVAEYVNGETLEHLLQEEGRVPVEIAADIIRDTATALGAAHKAGLVHRDIKPESIMIDSETNIKLTGLGLSVLPNEARSTGLLDDIATKPPYYLSPEECENVRQVGPASDIYSLGATFYRLIAGRLPFNGKNAYEIMQAQVSTPVEPPSRYVSCIPKVYDLIVAKMMDKSPQRRFASCEKLAQTITDVKDGKEREVLLTLEIDAPAARPAAKPPFFAPAPKAIKTVPDPVPAREALSPKKSPAVPQKPAGQNDSLNALRDLSRKENARPGDRPGRKRKTSAPLDAQTREKIVAEWNNLKCPHCPEKIVPGQIYCETCHNLCLPWKAAPSVVTKYAGWLIDMAICFIVAGRVIDGSGALERFSARDGLLFQAAVFAGIFFTYNVFFDTLGATVGKFLFGHRIVGARSGKTGPVRVFFGNVLRLALFPLDFVSPPWLYANRALHEAFVGLVVVRKSQLEKARRAAASGDDR